MEGNLELAKEHLTTYFQKHDEDITLEQAQYLANFSVKVLETAGQIAIHQIAAKGFNKVSKGVKGKATKVTEEAEKGVARMAKTEGVVNNTSAQKIKVSKESAQGKLQTFGKLGTVVKNPNLNVNDFSIHGMNHSITRALPSSVILNTVRNPAIVLRQSSGNYLYLTTKAAVVLNSKGRVVTTYPASMFDENILRVLNKTQ